MSGQISVFVAFFVFAVLLFEQCSGESFPLYKQCDGSWGGDAMGSKTICQVGCLISSFAMALDGRDYKVVGCDGYEVIPTPKSVNCWLRANNGYDDNSLYWSTAAKIADSVALECHTCSMDQSLCDSYLTDEKYIVLLNVNSGGHWVLATSKKDSTTYYVNDPSTRTEYTWSEVSRYAVYAMQPAEDSSTTTPPPVRSYTNFSSCDERWTDDLMEDQTMCQMGSLVSAAAMTLASRGFKINGDDITPKNLNEWLKATGGYGGGNLLYWHALTDLNSQITWQARVRDEQNMYWIQQQLGKDYALFGNYGSQKWCLVVSDLSSTTVSVICPDDVSIETRPYTDFTDGYLVYEMGTYQQESSARRLVGLSAGILGAIVLMML